MDRSLVKICRSGGCSRRGPMASVEESIGPRRQDIQDAVAAIVVEDYAPAGEAQESQLPLSIGEWVWVLEQHDSGWWGGYKDGEEHMGWFPAAACCVMAKSDAENDLNERSRTTGGLSAGALRTSDFRAVASPMGLRRGGHSPAASTETSRLQDREAELQEACLRLQAELEAERRKTESMYALEAKYSKLESAHAMLLQEHEKEKHAHRKTKAEAEHMAHEAECERWSLMRRKDSELTAKYQDYSSNADCSQQSSLQALVNAQRPASSDVSRRLHFDGSSGSRTPPAAPLNNSGMSLVSVSACAGPASMPLIPTATVTAMALPVSQPGSARHPAGLSRPSPRAAASAPGLAGLQWISPSGKPQPPSPHHSSRSSAPIEIPQVRSLVSEFERRSTSQGAPPRTRVDPSPNRQVVVVASQTATAAPPRARPTASAATSRSTSRDVPLARQYMPGSARGVNMVDRGEAQDDTPCGKHSRAGEPNFGMSPMPRQLHTAPSLPAPPGRAALAAMATSPSAQPAVSVQDRVKQFSTQQPGNRYCSNR